MARESELAVKIRYFVDTEVEKFTTDWARDAALIFEMVAKMLESREAREKESYEQGRSDGYTMAYNDGKEGK